MRFTVKRSDHDLLKTGDLPELKHFINGVFIDGGSETYSLVDPTCGRETVLIPRGGQSEVDRAVDAAVAAKDSWATLTPKERGDCLLRISHAVEENRERFIRLESWNSGKPLSVAADDVDGTVDILRFSAGAARSFSELGSADYVRDHLSLVLREPLGVIGAVVPWNYPLLMGAWKIAPILAAGNTLVLKPAEQTPLSLLLLAEVTADILPAGVYNVVLGTGQKVGAALTTHEKIDMIALTGSVSSGRAVAKVASQSLKRVHLELGGKAPVLIFADADLEKAAKSIRAAGFYNSGQECGAGTRVLVDETVAEEFTRLLSRQVSTLVVGEPAAGAEVEIGPLVSREHYERVLGFIRRALDEGAVATVGGSAGDGEGFFVEPTVLAQVKAGSEISQKEVFGPVVTVETFTTEREAIERANEVPYGLSGSVWTENLSRGINVSQRVDAGTVWVNCHLVLANDVPWGGFKGSGYGRDLSIYALEDYSRIKHIQINHADRCG